MTHFLKNNFYIEKGYKLHSKIISHKNLFNLIYKIPCLIKIIIKNNKHRLCSFDDLFQHTSKSLKYIIIEKLLIERYNYI